MYTKLAEIIDISLKEYREKNNVGNGENTDHQHFHTFPPKNAFTAFFLRVVEVFVNDERRRLACLF